MEEAGAWPPVIAIVGRSGSGKTSLVERLVGALGSRGLAVGAVKHASHRFLADRPGKDSYRLYESGAQAVALVSDEQCATFVRRAQPSSLAAALAGLPAGLDCVLAEGFSWEPVPRVLVTGPGRPPKEPDLRGGEVIAVAEVEAYREDGPPAFAPGTVTAVCDAVHLRLRDAGTRPPRLRPSGDGPLTF